MERDGKLGKFLEVIESLYRTGDRESREKLESVFRELSGEIEWVEDPDILLAVSKDRESPLTYRSRYTVIVITRSSYYEIVYRFSTGEPNYTLSEMSFGRVRSVEAGKANVSEEKEGMKNHALALVRSRERRTGEAAMNPA